MENASYNINDDNINFKDEILRYLSFWPFLIIFLFISLVLSFLYLRYANYTYKSQAVIEIIDESQDSEMALPTELTVFNRSMINLENEINRLNSYDLNSQVVKNLDFNVQYYTIGNIKISINDPEFWYDDYQINFKSDTDNIDSTLVFVIKTKNNKLKIESFDGNQNLLSSYDFKSMSTLNENHNLPFNLLINADKNLDSDRQLKLSSVKKKVNQVKNQIQISKLGKESDQLSLSIIHENPNLGEKYLNGLLNAFDNDGVLDRKLEYERTIEFVNERELILKRELELVEFKKQNFKKDNNLSDLNLDAGNNIDLKYSYNTEIFQAESQKSIAGFLLESLNQKEYDYLPINIGIDNFDLNELILDFNNIVSERNKYLSEAGINNFLVVSLQTRLDEIKKNISFSLESFLNSIELKINNLKNKEKEFDKIYNKVPENEKTLRSIERELSIKEALYLLLLQKREEAAINLAVVKPSIKVIDFPITDINSKSPNPLLIYLFSTLFTIAAFFSLIYIWFFIDNKVHTKEDFVKKLNKEIPLLCEIPFIKNATEISKNQNENDNARSILSESIRMLISNIKYITTNTKSCKSFIFTSSIKGEGKTLASVNSAINLSNDSNKKVLLIGADLRNPQIHKIFGVDKDMRGLTDILYKNDIQNFENYLQKYDNLDVIYSGSIPPNPNSLLSSDSFKNLFTLLTKKYDYLIIDSAPCLLVSDTFNLIDYADSVIYLFRANFTDGKIIQYINEHYESGRIKNLNVVLNGVGNSSSYGYKYGYQYGYKYGYKYGYNYGYGYGYKEEDS